jgi:rhamnogalacturonyl hydrolase YesR
MKSVNNLFKNFYSFLLLFSLFLINTGSAFSQQQVAVDAQNNLKIIKAIADRIIDESEFSFIDEKTKESYISTKNLPLTPNVKLKSIYTNWKYWNGVINLALIDLGEFSGDRKYIDHVIDKYDFILNSGNLEYFERQFQAVLTGRVDGENNPEFSVLNGNYNGFSFHQLFRLNKLDDFGAMGAALLEVNNFNQKPIYRKYLDSFADYLKNREHRLDDRTLARITPRNKTVWADDLFMSVPFMARYAVYMNDQEMLDDAVNQTLNFYDHLFDENSGLYFHCYHSDLNTNGVAHWGRANGWVIVATVDLLALLSENHPKRSLVIANLKKQIDGIARYQSQSGCWRQLLDKTDSYTESSCTAMFVYGIAKAVNNGWIDAEYASIAENGWKGLLTKITDDFHVKDICIGTGIEPSLCYYYNRPALTDEPHGLGPVIIAGVEYLKMTAK